MGEQVNVKMLMRHALGLPNEGKTSFRNRYAAARGTRQHELWMVLVASGLASVSTLSASLDNFALSREGAEDALLPGERLDREDFPNPAATHAAT